MYQNTNQFSFISELTNALFCVCPWTSNEFSKVAVYSLGTFFILGKQLCIILSSYYLGRKLSRFLRDFNHLVWHAGKCILSKRFKSEKNNNFLISWEGLQSTHTQEMRTLGWFMKSSFIEFWIPQYSVPSLLEKNSILKLRKIRFSFIVELFSSCCVSRPPIVLIPPIAASENN